MLHLTNAEENELKRLKTTTDDGILGDEELWAAHKRHGGSFIGYWGGEGLVPIGFFFPFFKNYSCP